MEQQLTESNYWRLHEEGGGGLTDSELECPGTNGHNFQTRCIYCNEKEHGEKKTFVFITGAQPNRFGFYWSKGATLKEARHNFKKVSGKFPPKEASTVIVHGTRADEAGIDEMGSLHYHKTDTVLYV